MRLAVCIPFRDEGGRGDLLMATVDWLTNILPRSPIVLGDSGHEQFNRGASRNKAVRTAWEKHRADLYIVCDADFLPPKDSLGSAIRNQTATLPYTRYSMLTPEATKSVVAGASPASSIPAYTVPVRTRRDQVGACGGCVVIPKEQFDQVGGWPEDFQGWGGEDTAFAAKVDTLIGLKTVPGIAYGLHHAQERTSKPSELELRYRAAWGNREMMRAVIGGESHE